ncbi:MAG: Flp family type IVb pilin [Acidimicrobiia bacterium]|nr:Flp family type IVb pilin [Acidimicrobiia bacterium]
MFTPAIAYVRYLKDRFRGDEGATMVEYGIMVALIAAVSILVIGFLGVDVFDAFQKAETNIDGSSGG